MVKDRLSEDDCKSKGWLLDGFPRTGAQADALVEIGVSPDYVLLLDVPDEELIKVRPTSPCQSDVAHLSTFVWVWGGRGGGGRLRAALRPSVPHREPLPAGPWYTACRPSAIGVGNKLQVHRQWG